MKESLSKMLGAASTLLLIGLFVVAAAPARADEVDLRIKALEQELTQLKGEQEEMKEAARAAKAKLPTFSYRQGRGMSIWAADRSWGFRTRIRWHHRLYFFDSDGIAEEGFSNWDQQLRRGYPFFTYYWDKGFYEVDYQQNLGANRSITIQKFEFKVRFDKINPWLPFYTIGPRVSGFCNRHDANWGSSSGGVFDRSMINRSGPVACTQVNAMALDWRNLPLGPGRMRILQFIISNQGWQSQATSGQQFALNDNKAFHGAFLYEPFQKSKNKWLKGLDFGFSAQIEDIHTSSSGRSAFRIRSTDRIALTMAEVANDMRGMRYYLTPGFGWKIGPYWLRTMYATNRGQFSTINDSRTTPGRGSQVTMDAWRIGNELWLWSPKGFLTGSTRRAGSLQLFVYFERDEMKGPNDGLRACSSTSSGSNCTAVHASDLSVGSWYHIKPGLSVGFEFEQYRVNKIGRGASDLKNTSSGSDVTFNSFELGMRVEW